MKIFSAIAIFIFTISASQGVSVEDCITNSKNEHFELKLWVKRYDLAECLGNQKGWSYLQNVTHLITVKDEEAIHKFVADDCPIIRDSLRCLRGYLDELRLCFNKEDPELELIKSFPTRMNSLFDIVCENEGENLIELLRNNGSNLFREAGDLLFTPCNTAWVEKSETTEIHDPTFKASEKTRQATADLRQCFLDATDTLQTSKVFFEKIFDALDADVLMGTVTLFLYEPGFKTIQKMSADVESQGSNTHNSKLLAAITGLNGGNDKIKLELVEILRNYLL